MAKKHKDRPILYACNVFEARETVPEWLGRVMLPATPIGQTGVLVVTNYGYVRQMWFDKKGKPRSRHTYVKSGTILVPTFRDVSPEEGKAIGEENWNTFGVKFFFETFSLKRLCFMQVDDLDAAIRQQDYIIDTYRTVPKSKTVKFLDYFFEITSGSLTSQKIVRRVDRRRTRLVMTRDYTEASLRQRNGSLTNVILFSPVFQDANTNSHKETLITVLRNSVRLCGEFPMRPVGKNMRSAKRSLLAAIRRLKRNETREARKLIETAIKKMVYPKEVVPDEYQEYSQEKS